MAVLLECLLSWEVPILCNRGDWRDFLVLSATFRTDSRFMLGRCGYRVGAYFLRAAATPHDDIEIKINVTRPYEQPVPHTHASIDAIGISSPLLERRAIHK